MLVIPPVIRSVDEKWRFAVSRWFVVLSEQVLLVILFYLVLVLVICIFMLGFFSLIFICTMCRKVSTEESVLNENRKNSPFSRFVLHLWRLLFGLAVFPLRMYIHNRKLLVSNNA